MSAFLRNLLWNRNSTRTQQGTQTQSFRDLVVSSTSSILNKVIKSRTLTSDEIKRDILENILHKHTIPFRQGRLVLLWKEKTTYEEYQKYLKRSVEERSIFPSYEISANRLYGTVDVILPFVVNGVNDGCSVLETWRKKDMDLTNSPKLRFEVRKNFLLRGEDVSVLVTDENFYFVYEGVAKLVITTKQIQTLIRRKDRRFTNVYNVTFKIGSDDKIFARTEEVHSALFLKHKASLVKLLMFKLWLFSAHGFGLNSLWMFGFLIFYYSFTNVLMFIFAFVIFKEILGTPEYFSVLKRKYQDQEASSRNNLDTLFKEMVYVGTQELEY